MSAQQNQPKSQQNGNNVRKETISTQMSEIAIENVAKGIEALKLKEERYHFLFFNIYFFHFIFIFTHLFSLLPTNLVKQFV